jgi:gas vesicle protein
MARDDSGTVVVAFVLGAIAGAAVALLMAPTSGEETRRVLADKAREGRERASQAARQGREFVNRQKETVSSAIERGREAYEQARSGSTSPQTGGGDNL